MNVLDVEPVLTFDELTEATCTWDTNPAAWLVRCRTCPARALWCESHYTEKMRRNDFGYYEFFCPGCGGKADDWNLQFVAVRV